MIDGPLTALAWSTFPDRASARSVASTLLQERLIACANLMPEVESVFEWRGEVEQSQEVGVLFKTDAGALDALTKRLGELHPYEIPAIIGWICQTSHPQTLTWISNLVVAQAEE